MDSAKSSDHGRDGDILKDAWSLVRILESALPAACKPPAISTNKNSVDQALFLNVCEDVKALRKRAEKRKEETLKTKTYNTKITTTTMVYKHNTNIDTYTDTIISVHNKNCDTSGNKIKINVNK